jgi:Tfp pilus assembly protein PilV
MNLLNRRKREGEMPQTEEQTRERGFTLIETAIALVVMMVIGLAVASLFVYAIKYNSGANDRLISLAIAQQRMERLRKTPFTDAVFSTDSTTETVTNASRTYDVVTTVCSTSSCGGSSSLKLITVQVTPLGATGQWSSTPVSVTALRATQTIGANY